MILRDFWWKIFVYGGGDRGVLGHFVEVWRGGCFRVIEDFLGDVGGLRLLRVLKKVGFIFWGYLEIFIFADLNLILVPRKKDSKSKNDKGKNKGNCFLF